MSNVLGMGAGSGNWRYVAPTRSLLASLAVALALAGPAADRALALPAPIYYGGSVSAVITVNFKTPPAAGSTVSCSLSLISNDARGESDSNGATAAVSGSQAICSVTIPYKWALTTPNADTMTMAYSVQGPVQYSSGIFNIIVMPAAGSILGPLNIVVVQ